jgi:hypothetical protein
LTKVKIACDMYDDDEKINIYTGFLKNQLVNKSNKRKKNKFANDKIDLEINEVEINE